MTDDEADSLIDAQLRNVSVPPELSGRLRKLTEWNDEELDRELAAVEMPALLAERLKDVPHDEPLDDQLRDTPTPYKLRASLREVAAASRRWRAAGLQTLAASLLLAITAGYGGLVWEIFSRARNSHVPPITTLTIMTPPQPLDIEAATGSEEVLISSAGPEEAAPAQESYLANASPLDPWTRLVDERAAAPVEKVLVAALGGQLNRTFGPMVLGSPPARLEDVPQLDLVRLPVSRGISTPLIPGYDRGFLLRTGVHPPILPGMNVVLQQSLAPLSVDTQSFDDVWQLAREKKRIAAERVRTEDFIAAVDHQLPAAAAGELSLTTLGSFSPFGPEGTRLLGLGVQAGDAVRRKQPSTHLVIAIDFSAGLARSGDWPWVREALLEALGRLGPQDRISLVFYQDEVLMGSSPLQARDASLLRQRLSGATPFGDVDPAAGLEAALDHALAAETPAQARHVVVLTDGHFELAGQHYRRLQRAAEQAEQGGVGLDLIRVGGRSVAQGATGMAQAMGIQEHLLGSRRELVRGLVKLLHGDEAIAAAEARLFIRFAPEAVVAYRLIGHEANTMAQLVSPSQTVELQAGDQALVLFELLPMASQVEALAGVELSWQDPSSGERRTIQRRIERSQLMQPWESTPVPFRAATIAAEAAEQLRGSRAALREVKWMRAENVELASLAKQVRSLSSSREETSLQLLVSLLDSLVPEHERKR